MMKRKLMITVLLIFTLTSLLIGGALASGKISIVVNGQTIKTDVSPRNVDGRVMVPISTISKALGANVSWDSKTQTVVINQKNAASASGSDLWKEELDLTGGDWAEIASPIYQYLVAYNIRDEASEEVWNKIVSPDYKGISFPGGGVYPSILDIKFIDAKKVEGAEQYKVRVNVVHYMNLSTPFIAEWEFLITSYVGKGNLIDDANIIKDTQLKNYTVFPGLTFVDVSEE
ncbi:copper amine oxidase N-terminal domain-containing protein [Paenibacillus aceti]|nr:copper amine oxidase N-terminal domain-containing protein [Paenibacillus aceti]